MARDQKSGEDLASVEDPFFTCPQILSSAMGNIVEVYLAVLLMYSYAISTIYHVDTSYLQLNLNFNFYWNCYGYRQIRERSRDVSEIGASAGPEIYRSQMIFYIMIFLVSYALTMWKASIKMLLN